MYSHETDLIQLIYMFQLQFRIEKIRVLGSQSPTLSAPVFPPPLINAFVFCGILTKEKFSPPSLPLFLTPLAVLHHKTLPKKPSFSLSPPHNFF